MSRFSSVKMSAGDMTMPSAKNASTCFSPKPSMSKALRDTKWRSRSTCCAGQINPPVQRRTASPSSRTAWLPQAGHLVGKLVRLGALRPLLQHDIDDLRDHVAGALDRHGVADADVRAAADRIAVVADALDVVLVVQRRVLHHHAADGDRLELGDRRQRAGAADLDLDVAQHGRRALGREFVRGRPARAARDKTQPLLQVEAVELCRRRRRCRSRAWRASSRCRDGTPEAPRPRRRSSTSGLVWKPAAFNHFSMPDCVSAGISLISPQA